MGKICDCYLKIMSLLLFFLNRNKEDKTKTNFGPDSEKYQYVVQELKEPNIYIVAANQVK